MSATRWSLVRASCNLAHLRESRLFVGQRETVHTPCFRIWIDLGRRYESGGDFKSLTSADANYLVTNGWVRATIPDLFVNRRVGFASNLPVIESVMAKPCWQRLIGTAFFTTSL